MPFMIQNADILDKQSLRRLVTQLKRQLSDFQKQQEADSVFAKLECEQFFADAENIAVYWSLDDELPTQRFIEKWYKQKKLYLPVVVGDTLIFRRYSGSDGLKKGAFGIPEPIDDKLADTQMLDMIVVPGVAFDLQNNRMGRGRGFYDRLLPQVKAKRVGVAFKSQIFRQIPVCDSDVPMDIVLCAAS